jgi:hypothetical protein
MGIIGQVESVWRYPVKSMRGETQNEGGSRGGWDRALPGRRQGRHHHAEPAGEIERDQPRAAAGTTL